MSKYARTYHLPWSPGATSDDKISNDISSLIGTVAKWSEKTTFRQMNTGLRIG